MTTQTLKTALLFNQPVPLSAAEHAADKGTPLLVGCDKAKAQSAAVEFVPNAFIVDLKLPNKYLARNNPFFI